MPPTSSPTDLPTQNSFNPLLCIPSTAPTNIIANPNLINPEFVHTPLHPPTSLASPPSPPPTNSTTLPPLPTCPPGPPTKKPTHHMTTRLKSGHLKPKAHLSLHQTSSPLEPTSYKQACTDPSWMAAMQAELKALTYQQTWRLVPPHAGKPIIGSKWTYKLKRKADESIDRYKARLVAQGYSQIYGIDYAETFSPVAKSPIIRLLLTLAFNRNWNITQVDISNAFLNGALHETVYMRQPPGFVDPHNPSAVCLLQKALYGLKQSPRQWNSALTSHLHSIGFSTSTADPSLFLRQARTGSTYVLVYVDDLLITGSDSPSITRTMDSL